MWRFLQVQSRIMQACAGQTSLHSYAQGPTGVAAESNNGSMLGPINILQKSCLQPRHISQTGLETSTWRNCQWAKPSCSSSRHPAGYSSRAAGYQVRWHCACRSWPGRRRCSVPSRRCVPYYGSTLASAILPPLPHLASRCPALHKALGGMSEVVRKFCFICAFTCTHMWSLGLCTGDKKPTVYGACRRGSTTAAGHHPSTATKSIGAHLRPQWGW